MKPEVPVPAKDSLKKKFFLPGTSLIALCLAIFFWFLSALDNKYHSEFSFSVTDTSQTKREPIIIQAEIKASGFDLFFISLKSYFSELQITAGDSVYQSNINSNGEYEILNFTRAHLIRQYPEIEIVNIQYNNLPNSFVARSGKEVQVMPLVYNKEILPGYFYGKATVTPDKVWVSGKKEILDTLEYVFAEPIILQKTNTSIRVSRKLRLPSGVTSEFKKVTITLPVEQLTEKSIQVIIEPQQTFFDKKIVFLPSKAKITYLVRMSDYEKEIHAKVTASPDKQGTAKGNVFLQLTCDSSFIRNVRMNPPIAEYLIIKK